MALVAHLRDDLVLPGGLGHGAAFGDRVGQRLLAVDVLALLHGRDGRDRVVMVGRGDHHGVDPLVQLVEHLAEVAEPLGLGIVLEAPGRRSPSPHRTGRRCYCLRPRSRTSPRPMPPTPMPAIFSFSLGGVWPLGHGVPRHEGHPGQGSPGHLAPELLNVATFVFSFSSFVGNSTFSVFAFFQPQPTGYHTARPKSILLAEVRVGRDQLHRKQAPAHHFRCQPTTWLGLAMDSVAAKHRIARAARRTLHPRGSWGTIITIAHAPVGGPTVTHRKPTARTVRGETMRLVRVLSLVAAVETFLLMVMGTVVRVTGASKSIPDWPLAFGTLVPHMTPLVFLEWSHRLLVLLVVVTLVALVAAQRACQAGYGCTAWLRCSWW